MGFFKKLAGLLVGGGGLLLLSLLYSLIRGREGMGMGDVKLLAMLGAWLGWQCLIFILLFASIQGVLTALFLWLSGVKLKPPLPEEWEEDEQEAEPEPEHEPEPEPEPSFLLAAIPFGPFLAAVAMVTIVWGQPISDWILGLVAG